MANLAGTYALAGDDARALARARQAQAAFERLKKTTRANALSGIIAMAYAGMGEHAKALAIYADVLATARRLKDPDLPQILNNFGMSCATRRSWCCGTRRADRRLAQPRCGGQAFR